MRDGDGAASLRSSDRSRAGLAAGSVVVWAVGAAVATRVGYWTGLGGTALLLGAVALVARRPLAARPVAERSVGYYPAVVAAALACGTGMAVAAWTLYPALARLVPHLVDDKVGLYAAFAALPRFEAALLLPLIIGAEELVWRGVVQEVVGQRTTRLTGVLWCALIYGLATLPCGSPLLASTAFACGLVWSGLRVATRGLLAPFICHLFWAVLVLFARPVRLG